MLHFTPGQFYKAKHPLIEGIEPQVIAIVKSEGVLIHCVQMLVIDGKWTPIGRPFQVRAEFFQDYDQIEKETPKKKSWLLFK